MTRYLRISGLCFSLAVIVSLFGSAAAFAEKTKVDAVPSSKTVKKAQELIAPSDLQKAVAPVDVEKVIAPIDSEKVVAPPY